MKKLRLIVLIVLSFFATFFVFGCAQYLSDYASSYSNELNSSNKLGLFDYGAMGECRNTTCICFVCDSEKGILSDIQGKFYNATWRSLPGNCTFVSGCNETVFGDYWATDNKEVRMFMIGQGTTFLDFNDANPYCKDGLKLAVKWLVASKLDPYQLPKEDRAKCFLNYGTMPLYILYSNGTDVNIDRAREIAQELKDLGPVIITTEIDFNSSDPDALYNVSEQVREIDSGCTEAGKRKCLIALAPRMGDYEGVNKFFTSYPDLKDKVDIIAYGINTRYSTAKCDNPGALFSEAVAFSEFTLTNYSKPSLIAYLLLDPAPNGNASCTWTEAGVANTYKYFFPFALPSLLKRGTIGIALYRFNATEDPLNCPACRVANNTEYLNNWFAFCQKYKADVANLPRGDMFAVFPNESTGSCMFASNPQYLGNIPFSGMQFTAASTPAFDPKEETFFRCDWCVNNETEWPHDLWVEPAGAPPDNYCFNYSELDYYADLRDLDPMLVRAIAWTETGFDQCGVSTVNMSSNCNIKDLRNYPTDLEEYYPPGSSTKEYFPKPIIEDKTGQFCADGIHVDGAVGKTMSEADRKFCAYGLMQTIIYPGYVFDYYSEKGITLNPGDYAMLGHCFENASTFNPFNASHSACLGTWEFNKHVEWALPIVKSNAVQLNLLDNNSQVDENKVRIMAVYLALLAYNRGPGGASGVFYPWMNDFVAQSHADVSFCKGEDTDPDYCNGAGKLKECAGYTDFLKYVQCRWNEQEAISKAADPNYKEKPNYPYVTLARYRALVNKCVNHDRTGCPPDVYIQRLISQGNALPEGEQPQPQPQPQPSPP